MQNPCWSGIGAALTWRARKFPTVYDSNNGSSILLTHLKPQDSGANFTLSRRPNQIVVTALSLRPPIKGSEIFDRPGHTIVSRGTVLGGDFELGGSKSIIELVQMSVESPFAEVMIRVGESVDADEFEIFRGPSVTDDLGFMNRYLDKDF